MVSVPAGEFTMGRLEGYSHGGREDPAHKVTLTEYQIGRYPITNAQYRLFAQDTGHKFSDGKDDHPASGITWQDAWLFCAWLRYKTGQPYHLPTEAEWEKAATWDPKNNKKQPFPWGTEQTDKYCNVLSSGPKGTTPVGSYSPQGDSPCGCADMIGNVEEWCNTAMREYPYDASDGCEELRAEGRRAIRGGDWYTLSPPSAIRRNAPSDAWIGLWGFRVALGNSLNEAHKLYEQKLEKWLQHSKAEHLAQINQKPNNAQMWYDLGAWHISLVQMGIHAFSETDEALTKALEITSHSFIRLTSSLKSPLAWVYYNRAYARLELQRYQEALEDINQAIALDASDGDAYMLRAQVHVNLGLWDKAKQDWEKSLKIKPQQPNQFVVQAQISAGTKDYETALKIMTEIIERPLFFPLPRPDTHFQRGQIYETLGKLHEAMSDYCHYLLWRPNAPEGNGLKQKLEAYRENF
jgi:tetratricopeptide (TPR) repeat protein